MNQFVPVKEVVRDMLAYMRMAMVCVALDTLKYGERRRRIPMPLGSMPLDSNMTVTQARKILKNEWAKAIMKQHKFTVVDNQP